MGTVIDCLQRQNEGRPDTVSVMGMCGKRLHLYRQMDAIRIIVRFVSLH